jgi:tRNA-modifying protein YgfZ
MPQASLAILDERGVLAIAGPDRRSFLQGLVSNDVAKIAADRAIYAALLTAQGKYLHDFIMVEVGDEIWLDAEAARLADLKRRLSMYRLRAKIELAERPELAVAAVFGAEVPAALDLPGEAGAARPLGGGIALIDPRLVALGGRLVGDRAGFTEAAAPLTRVAPAEYDRHRLSLGIPDGSRDLVPEKSLLLEAGFDELNGVDWQKGCYVGQELTARTKYRGLIKRRLLPVRIEGDAPLPGTVLVSDGREIGEMRSSRAGLGLAVLRLDAVAAGRGLRVGDAELTPSRLAWMPELKE